MVSGKNKIPLEKTLIDISLRGGINEADKPELVDWTKFVLSAENVLLEEGGSYVQRPGTALVGSADVGTVDDIGETVWPFYRLLNFGSGIGVVGNSYRMFSLDETLGTFVPKGKLPEYSVNLFPAGSVQEPDGVVAANTVYGYATGCLTTESYFVVASKAAYTASDTQSLVSIVDRNSGQIIRKYSFAGDIRMALAGDRYLHIYESDLLTVEVYQIDLEDSGSPRLALGSSVALTVSGADIYIIDALSLSDRTVAVMWDDGGAQLLLESIDTSQASMDDVSSADFSPQGCDVDSSGNVYIVGDYAGTNFRVEKYNSSLVLQSATDEATVTLDGRARIAVGATGSEKYITVYTDDTVGGGDIQICRVYRMVNTGAWSHQGTLSGWTEQCQPWHNRTTDKFYGFFCKSRYTQVGVSGTYEELGAVVMVQLDNQIEVEDSFNLTRFRPVATLDTYAGAKNSAADDGMDLPPKAFSPDLGATVTVPVTSKVSASGYVHNVALLKAFNPAATHNTGDGFISGGMGMSYDGLRPTETSFVDCPSIYIAAAGAGTLAAGQRNYVAVFKKIGADGQAHYSRCSPIASFTNGANDDNVIRVTLPTVTYYSESDAATDMSHSGRVVCDLYRTETAGTQYHLVTTLTTADPGGGMVVFDDYNDALADADLISRPLLYRQPGSPGTAVDRFYPPASTHAVRHKDRIFVCSGSNLYYSSYAVEGEAPWFNPVFYIPIMGGTGPIVGMSSTDGYLVVFKRDGIWIIDGDGPPENGGSGTEFSVPRRVNTEFGCVEPRSIVRTPNGVMYQSSRGIELLNRSFQVQWKGDRIQRTLNLNPFITGSCMDLASGVVYFCCHPEETVARDAGVILVYSTTMDAWTTIKLGNEDDERGSATDMVSADVAVAGVNAQRTIILDAYRSVRRFSDDTSYDADYLSNLYYVPMSGQTGWIRGPSTQDRFVVDHVLVLYKKNSNHKLYFSAGHNYKDEENNPRRFGPEQMGTLIDQALYQPKQIELMSLSLNWATEPPDTIPAGLENFGSDILSITPVLSLKAGGMKVAARMKG